MSSPRDEELASEMEESAYQLRVFRGLPKALGRLLLRDGRSRKEIAEAAGLNASMLSGFCSGRRMPSLEHLDRLLNELGVGLDELNFELQAIRYRPGDGLSRAGSHRLPAPDFEEASERMMGQMHRLQSLFDRQSQDLDRKLQEMEERWALRKGNRLGER